MSTETAERAAAQQHDPGGKVRFALQPGVQGAAQFSECGQYRHWLARYWGESPTDDYALWIGLNPSTAEADCDDPTIRREIEFTRREGLRGYRKVNLFDYRATNPKALLAPGVRPCSAENYATIARLSWPSCCLVVAAWGAAPTPLRYHVTYLLTLLAGRRIVCLGVTKDGSPRHPLYVRGDAPLVEWRPRRRGRE
jgi:hypothetical protein